MDEQEEGRPRPHRARLDDEYLKHPHSGASVRNPFLDKCRSAPILFQETEFKHNCLEDVMQDYHCITVSEAGFREMMRTGRHLRTVKKELAAASDGGTAAAGATATVGGGLVLATVPHPLAAPSPSPLARAALSTLGRLRSSFEFVVALRKSTFVPRAARRRQVHRHSAGVLVDKLNIEVVDDSGPGLRIEDVKEGLVAAWNRQHPAFQVHLGDRVLKANGMSWLRATPAQILEELEQSTDRLRLTIRRTGQDPCVSKTSAASKSSG